MKRFANLVAVVFLLVACSEGSENSSPSTDAPESDNSSAATTIFDTLLGEWIQIDTQAAFKIDNRSLRPASDESDLDSVTNLSSILKPTSINEYSVTFSNEQSHHVANLVTPTLLRVEATQNGNEWTYFLIRSGINNAKVRGKMVSLASTSLGLTESTRVAQSYDLEFKNSDSAKTATVNDDGTFEASDLRTGNYSVTAKSKVANVPDVQISSVRVNQADDHIGVITVDAPEYNFKTDFAADEHFYFNQETYKAKLKVTNVGTKVVKGVNYQLSSDDPIVKFDEATKAGILNSIEPGKAIEIEVKVTLSGMQLVEEKQIPIAIKLRDVKGKSWNDIKFITIYNTRVNINVSTLTSVSGMIVFKDRRMIPLKAGTTHVPYITNHPYKILLSAANFRNEAVYSIGVEHPSESNENMQKFFETSAFEPNDEESVATDIPYRSKITSYLHVGDLDMYTFTLTDPNILGFRPIASATIVGESNGDNVANPGEEIYVKVKVRNNGAAGAEGVTGEASTTHSGITFAYYTTTQNKMYFNDVSAGSETCGFTYSYFEARYGYCGESSSIHYLKLILASSTPSGTAPITVTLTDSWSNTYTATFDLTVADPAASFSVTSGAIVYDTNSNGVANKGETVYVKVKVRNNGAAGAEGVTGVASTTHSGITFAYYTTTQNKMYFNDASAGSETCGYTENYQTYYGSCDASSSYYLRLNISAGAASGLAPIAINLTDAWGNTYTTNGFTLTIP